MMNHEECLAYIKRVGDVRLDDVKNYYGILTVYYEDGVYGWYIEDYDGYGHHPIPDYLGDALVNYHREQNCVIM